MRNDKIIFGKRIKEEREKLGITREDFAKQNDITYSALSMYERGERSVRDEIKIRIAKNLNISLDYLIGMIDEPLPYKDVEQYLTGLGMKYYSKGAEKSLAQWSKLKNDLQQNDIISTVDSEISDERIKAIVQILNNNKEFIDILEQQYNENKNPK
ncbi:MAG: helix-turn-helix transcriptional regulator [Clostridia bacterium]|nr:helix-turn-helix transcriptional regulator [Clostridia bacterium]